MRHTSGGEYDLVVRNGTVLTLDGAGRVLQPGSIAIEKGRIAALQEGKPGFTGRRELDAQGKLVLPGLVNAHTHLFQTLLRGCFRDLPLLPWLGRIYSVGNHLRREEVALSARLGCLESLRSGVTTLVEHTFLHPDPTFVDEVFFAFREAGIRGAVCRAAMDTGSLVPARVKAPVARAVEEWERLLRRYHRPEGGPLLLVGPNTPGINASNELVQASALFAAEHGLRWNPHVAESTGIVERIREEQGDEGVVAYLERVTGGLDSSLLAVHCVHLTQTEIELLGRAGASCVYNPVSNMYLADGIAPVEDLLQAGVMVSLGTDGAASNASQDLFEVMKTGALLQKLRYGARAFPCEAVLRAATLGGARALGWEQEIGSLEPGKRADLIILGLEDKAHAVAVHDPYAAVVYSARASDVETVVVDGGVILAEGKVATLDEEEIVRKAQPLGRALLARLEGSG